MWLAASAALGLLLAACLRSAWAGYRLMDSEVHPPRNSVGEPPLPLRQQGLREVSFDTQDGLALAGWYVPSKNDAAVVLCHGLSQTRAQLSGVAQLLVAQGYGVLLFDFAAHGKSGGDTSTYGAREALQVQAGVAFALRQPEVKRVGALGFSLGGYSALAAAAKDPSIRALAVLSAVEPPGEVFERERVELGPLGARAAQWVLGRAGVDPDAVRPLEDMAALGERPKLIVVGADDPYAPKAAVEALLARAAEPRELLVIPAAGHDLDALLKAPPVVPSLLALFQRGLAPEQR